MERRLRTMLDDAESSSSIDYYGKPMAAVSSVSFSPTIYTDIFLFAYLNVGDGARSKDEVRHSCQALSPLQSELVWK